MEYADIMITPWPMKQLLVKMTDNTNKAMYAWHCDGTKQKKADMWKDRIDFLKASLGQ